MYYTALNTLCELVTMETESLLVYNFRKTLFLSSVKEGMTFDPDNIRKLEQQGATDEEVRK